MLNAREVLQVQQLRAKAQGKDLATLRTIERDIARQYRLAKLAIEGAIIDEENRVRSEGWPQ